MVLKKCIKRYIKRLWLLLICFLLNHAGVIYAQYQVDEIISEITTAVDEETDYSELYERLSWLLYNPININKCSTKELEQLDFLTDFQIHSLLHYRDEHEGILTVYELNYIHGFNKNLVQKLTPFITFSGTRYPSMSKKFSHHESICKLTRKINNKQNKHENPYKYYFRHKTELKNNLNFGLTLEKDPGEVFFKGSNKHGFDFNSGYIYYKNKNKVVPYIILGDFNLGFGQGIAFWNNRSINKSSIVSNIRKRGKGVSCYTSVNENLYFRGISTCVNIHENIRLIPFISIKKIDANVMDYDSINSRKPAISTFINTGYHITEKEIKNEKKIGEYVTGGNLMYQNNNYEFSVSGYYLGYNCNIMGNSRLYSKYKNPTTKQFFVSADFLHVLNKIILFGEFALYNKHSTGGIIGITAKLPYNIECSVLGRYYDKKFINTFGNAFSENSNNNNENGCYFGIRVPLSNHVTIMAYSDHYKFPWLKSNSSAPSSGKEYFTQIDYTVDKSLSMYLRYKTKQKFQNSMMTNDKLNSLNVNKTSRLRYNISYQLNVLKLQNRLEVSFNHSSENHYSSGYLVIQDIQVEPGKIPLKLYTRYMVFDTDNYDSRIYAYENDLLYSFTIPGFFSKGIRFYIMTRINFTKKIKTWIKYGFTNYHNPLPARELTSLPKGTQHDIKIQLQIRL